MSDNSLDAGSELNPKDADYLLPSVRVPQSIDGEPYEVAVATLSEYITHLIALVGYAEGVEAMVRAAMLDEALGLEDRMLPAGGAANYPEATYELQAVTRANKAIGIALDLLHRAERELALPVAESRRAILG